MSRYTTATPVAVPGDGVDFGIAEPVVPVELWQRDSTNHYSVRGVLAINGQPVANAHLAANAYVLPSRTDSTGAYTVKGDKTVLDRAILSVRSLDGAQVGGQPLDDADIATLTEATTTIETAFVMTLDENPELSVGSPNQVIAGRLTFADGTTPVPPIRLWGYELSGNLVDENDQPIADAYVSIRDDEGETWSLSTKTANDGRYALRFYPVGGSRFTLRVAEGMSSFQSHTDVGFADQSSATLDIRLDRTSGMVMGIADDGALEPVTVPGAEYVGYMVGLSNGRIPVASVTTWPDADGRFTITIPELTATAPVAFFQARFRFFAETALEPGSDIGPDIIPDSLADRIPTDLPPFITPRS